MNSRSRSITAFVLAGVFIVAAPWFLWLPRAKTATVVDTTSSTVSTQPTYAGKVGEVSNQDGVPFVVVVLTEGPIPGYKERVIAGTNLVVGDIVLLVWAYAPGGKNFPVARLIGMTNSLP